MQVTEIKRLIGEGEFQPMVSVTLEFTTEEMQETTSENIGHLVKKNVQNMLDDLNGHKKSGRKVP